jgi:hypothetical protein
MMKASLAATLRKPLIVGAVYAATYLAFALSYCWRDDTPGWIVAIGFWLNPLTYLAAFLISAHRLLQTLATLGIGAVVSFIFVLCACLLCVWLGRISKWLLLVPLALLLWYSSFMHSAVGVF